MDNFNFAVMYLIIYGIMDAYTLSTPIYILLVAFSIGIMYTELTTAELVVGVGIGLAMTIYTRFYYPKKHGFARWALADGLTLTMLAFFLPPAVIAFMALTEDAFARAGLKIVRKFKPDIEYYPVLTVFMVQIIIVYAVALFLKTKFGFDMWAVIPFVWRRWELLVW